MTGPWSLLQAKAKVPDDVTEQVNHAGQDARAYRAPSWRTSSKDSHVKHFPPLPRENKNVKILDPEKQTKISLLRFSFHV